MLESEIEGAPQEADGGARRSRLPWRTLFVIVFASLYAASVLGLAAFRQPGVDSHYHYTMAMQIGSGDLLPDMARALPFTVYSEWNVDHYWGFHLLLSPFTWTDDPEMGMKAATVFLFTLVFFSLFAFLYWRRVPYAWAWACLPLLLTTMDWRYMHLRGGQLMVPVMLAFAASAFFVHSCKRRRILLFLLSCGGMICYQGAVVLLPLHLAGLAGLWLFCRSSLRRKMLWEPAITVGGLAAGLTLNPYMDAQFQTWRFAGHHLFTMGIDRDGLYPRLAEFHGFPPEMFIAHPEWGALALLVVGAWVWVVWQRTRGEEVPPFLAVAAGLAALGVAMAATALRATEYAVPLGVLLVAAAATHGGEGRERPLVAWGVGVLLVAGAISHMPLTLDVLNHRYTLHTRMYRNAAPVLEANGQKPVLNLVEADYNLLVWQFPDVVCVQGLSRYFLIGNRPVYDDVQILKDEKSTDREKIEALHRFSDRGVELVANHLRRTSMLENAFTPFAERHPSILEPVYTSFHRVPITARAATIFRIDRDALAQRL